MSTRDAPPGRLPSIAGASPGNFSREGVSQKMGLHLTGMAHEHDGAGDGVVGVAAFWTPWRYEAAEGISTTSWATAELGARL